MNLQDLVSSISGKFNEAKTNLSNWKSVATNPEQRNDFVSNVIKPTVSAVASIPSQVANVAHMATNPYGRAQIGDFVQSKLVPSLPFDTSQYYHTDKKVIPWDSRSEAEKKQINLVDTADEALYTPVKDATPQLQPRFQNPVGDYKGNAIRDNQIKGGGYTPEVSQYLKTIGTVMKPAGALGTVEWAAGVAHGGDGPKFVELAPQYHDPHTMGHELMHQIDAVGKKYKPEEFLRDFNESVKENPVLMKDVKGFMDYYQKAQPQYINNPKTLALETYAQLGAILGPDVLNTKMGKYYTGIFNPPVGTKPVAQMASLPVLAQAGGATRDFSPPPQKIIIRTKKK